MTPLARLLARQIEATGPISVADYMAACLMHPEHGFYSTRDPFGAHGAFTTAPEISQMFGELIGLCLGQTWVDQGRPSPFTLAELGPGRGTLMADLLRAVRRVPGFIEAACVHLVEASPALRARQREALAGAEAIWLDAAADLPDAPLFVLANEFFDALPIRQFLRDPDGWRERQLALVDGALRFGLAPPAPYAALDHRLEETRAGDVVETRPAAAPIIQDIAARIARQGGAALIIDYGGWRSLGDTLQALRGHASEDPLAHPGEADLTAHVDFEALADAAVGVAHSALTPQGAFLERLGISARARALSAGLSGPSLDSHVASHRRLTHPEEMGSLFRVMSLYPKDARPPPGLDP